MDERLSSGVHEQYAAEAHTLGAALREHADERVRVVLTASAQAAARARDDDHVGTEHIVLGLYDGEVAAAEVLQGNGVSREVFESVLDDEPGPSPAGIIPYTTRAMMVGAQAVLEARRRGDAAVNDLHLLLGVVGESRRWEEQHAWGPHHLSVAAEKAGTSIEALERAARAALAGS